VTRLVSKSKQPPELGESLIVPAELPGAFTVGHWIHSTDDGLQGAVTSPRTTRAVPAPERLASEI
jgi:hypothetical protein